jgi:hypothetical protein
MSTAEYATHRACSTRNVRGLRKNGALVLVEILRRIGSRTTVETFIDVEASDALLDQGEKRPAAPGGVLMTTTQYAAHRGLSTSYVRRLRRRGELPIVDNLIVVPDTVEAR